MKSSQSLFQHHPAYQINLSLYLCTTPKCVTTLRYPSPRHCAYRQHSSFRRNVAAVASRWQHCVQMTSQSLRTHLSATLKCAALIFENFLFQIEKRNKLCCVMIWPNQDLNLKPPVPRTSALPFNQLAGTHHAYQNWLEQHAYQKRNIWHASSAAMYSTK